MEPVYVAYLNRVFLLAETEVRYGIGDGLEHAVKTYAGALYADEECKCPLTVEEVCQRLRIAKPSPEVEAEVLSVIRKYLRIAVEHKSNNAVVQLKLGDQLLSEDTV